MHVSADTQNSSPLYIQYASLGRLTRETTDQSNGNGLDAKRREAAERRFEDRGARMTVHLLFSNPERAARDAVQLRRERW